MSNKFDYLLEILYKIDRTEKVTVHSLMNDFEKGERTILRYIQILQTAKFPILYSKNKKSYVFEEGYFLLKPDISVEEELALALAKNLLKNYGSFVEKGISSIEQKLTHGSKGISKHIVIKPDPISPLTIGILEHLSDACKNFRVVEIIYKSAYSQNETKRQVNPYYIFYHDNIWYLRGYCELREEIRTFAIDRIISLKVLNKHFTPVKIDPDAELAGAFGPVVGEKPVRVILRFDAEVKPFVLRKEWHNSQKVRELQDGRFELSFEVNGLQDIKSWAYKWLPHIEIASPQELKNTIREELKQALNKFE